MYCLVHEQLRDEYGLFSKDIVQDKWQGRVNAFCCTDYNSWLVISIGNVRMVSNSFRAL